MSQVIHTQLPSHTSNANAAALPGFDLSNPDFLRIDGIVLSTARNKKGGYNLQAGTLFIKVAKEVKSLAGMSEHQRMPDNVAGYIQSQCKKVAEVATKELLDNGFNPLRQSSQKIHCNFKDLQVTRRVQQSFEKLQHFSDQLKDIHWLQVTAKESILGLENKQPKDAEEGIRIETKITILKEKLEGYAKLERSIKAEKEYQEKQLAVTEKPSETPTPVA